MPALAALSRRWFAAAALAAPPAPALAADPCAGLAAYRAEPAVSMTVAEPVIRNDLPHTVLTSRRGHAERVLMGKVHVAKKSRFKSVYKLHRAPGGGVCVALRRVEVSVELAPVTIYIAEQSKPGSCHYRVTLRHEEKHLDHERRAMAAALDKLEGRIRAIRRPFHAPGETAARQRAEQMVDGWLAAMLRNAERDAARNHHRLDSSDAARREAAQCD